jgi:hypothetical protein
VVALSIRCILGISRAERLSLRLVRVLISVLDLSLTWTLILGLLISGVCARLIRLRPILIGHAWLIGRSSPLVILSIQVA